MLNQAVILVGGRGTRLGPLTDDLPKPLLPVGGRPFLGHLIDELVRQGCNDILLLAGYRGDRMDRFCTEMQRPGLRLRCVTEPEPAGTGGALRRVTELLAPQFLLLNGDTLFDVNLNDLVTPPLPADGSVLARMALRRVPDTARYGAIALHRGRVTAILEKGRRGEGLINGGLYLLDRRAVDRLPLLPCSIETGLLPHLAVEGAVEGRIYESFFLDIGVPDDFALAQSAVPARRSRRAAFFDRDGLIKEDIGFVYHLDRITWLPGAKEAVKRLNDAGFLVFIVDKQDSVGHGLSNEENVHTLQRWMQQDLNAVGAHVDAFYHGPNHPGHDEPLCRTAYTCRRPEPGMLLQAMAEWPVEPNGSVLIGAWDTDAQATRRAGVERTLHSGGDLDSVVADILARSVDGFAAGHKERAFSPLIQ